MSHLQHVSRSFSSFVSAVTFISGGAKGIIADFLQLFVIIPNIAHYPFVIFLVLSHPVRGRSFSIQVPAWSIFSSDDIFPHSLFSSEKFCTPWISLNIFQTSIEDSLRFQLIYYNHTPGNLFFVTELEFFSHPFVKKFNTP